jgi:lipoprotein-anchoring transpeptidase ErfK/SrfK
MSVSMGRFYLPPHVVIFVAVLAAIGAVLTILARPASGQETPPDVAPAPAAVPQPALAAEPVERAPLRAPDPLVAPALAPDPGAVVLRPAGGSTIVVRSRPRGPVVARLDGETEFGSPTTLAVASQRGRWLGVVTTHVSNGRLGWIDPQESRVRTSTTRVHVVIDLSARRLVVRRGSEVVRRMTVAIGRAGSPTPVGRFAVTDKLPGSRYGSYYGCCILALSAHQPNLPPGWTGGDRIAVHGTNDPSSIGAAVSAGCPRASAEDMRFLMRVVPLGAPVTVRA